MGLVARIDSSTQSTKVLLVDAADGTVVAEASAPHPDGKECDPERWWGALGAAGRGLRWGRGGRITRRGRWGIRWGCRACGADGGRGADRGGAKSEAVRVVAPTIFGLPVVVPAPAQCVALGAARQAAWALSGLDSPPEWAAAPAVTYEAAPAPGVRARYAALRDDAAAWQAG